MAGGYTHLTLVRRVLTDFINNGRASGAREADSQAARALATWGRFAYLGGVSPDYPYLCLDAEWADLMHKGGTHHMIRAAMPKIAELRRQNPTGREWQQQFAWLLGFVSHIVADVVVHPVVNLAVGPYELNKGNHRICEMNQDVWIYTEEIGLDLHYSDNMKTEISGCGRPFDLEDGVEELWKECLESAYDAPVGDDQIDKWHAMFQRLVDFAEDGMKIPLFGRHLASGGAAYPPLEDAEKSAYVKKLVTPASNKTAGEWQQPADPGEEVTFERVYAKVVGHVAEAWDVLIKDLFEAGTGVGVRHATVFGDWSLDTGVDNESVGKVLKLWPYDVKLV